MNRPFKYRILLHLITVITVTISIFGWTGLHINKDLLAIFPKDNPEVKAMQAIKTEFENGGRVLLLLEADLANATKEKNSTDTDEELAMAADSLAAYLDNSGHISAVLHKPLWEQEKLVLADLLAYLWINGEEGEAKKLMARTRGNQLQATIDASIEELSFELDPAAIATLSRDPLRLMNHIDLKLFSERNPSTKSTVENNHDSSQDLFASKDGSSRLLIVYPAKSDLSSGEWCRELKRIVTEWKQNRIDAFSPVNVNFTGGPAFASEIAGNVKRDISVTILISSVFSGLVFWFLVRNNRLIHIQIFLVALILFVTYGFGALCLDSMSLMSVGFASILIGLTVDYGMIICVEAKRSTNRHMLREATTKPIIFSSISTSAVFASLCYSKLPGIQELGFLVATGILFGAFVLLVYYIPFAYLKGREIQSTEETNAITKNEDTRKKSWKKLLVFCLILLLLFPLLSKSIPQVTFDLHVMTSSNSAAKQALDKLKNKFPENFEDDKVSLLIQTDHPQEIVKKIKGIHAPNQSIALALYPTYSRQQSNAEKLRSVVTLKNKILKSLQTNGFKNDALRLNKQVIENIEQYLEELDNSDDTVFLKNPLAAAWMRPFMYFHRNNDNLNQSHGGILLKVNHEKWVSSGNHEFVKSGAVQVTSWKQIEQSISKQIPKDLAKMLLFVSIITAIMLYSAIRDIKDTIVGAFCLVTPIALVSYLVEASSLQWDFLNIFSIPLLLGLGVDYVIHIVFAHRRSLKTDCDTRSYIRKTLLCCGSTSVVGFLALGASSNQAFVSLGIVCGIGVIFTMLFCLILMPYLLGSGSLKKT